MERKLLQVAERNLSLLKKKPTILYYNKTTHGDYTHTDIYIYTQTIQLFFILQNIFSLGLQYNLKINRIKLCFFSIPIKYVHLLQLLSFALLSSSYILYNLSTLTLFLSFSYGFFARNQLSKHITLLCKGFLIPPPKKFYSQIDTITSLFSNEKKSYQMNRSRISCIYTVFLNALYKFFYFLE